MNRGRSQPSKLHLWILYGFLHSVHCESPLCCTTVRTTLSMTESEAPQTGMSTTLSINTATASPNHCLGHRHQSLRNNGREHLIEDLHLRTCLCGTTGMSGNLSKKELRHLHCPEELLELGLRDYRDVVNLCPVFENRPGPAMYSREKADWMWGVPTLQK